MLHSFYNLNTKLTGAPRSTGGGDRAALGENMRAVSTLEDDAGTALRLQIYTDIFSLGKPVMIGDICPKNRG